MHRIVFVFILFIVSFLSTAQSIRVVNENDLSPIADVFVYNKNQSALTNSEGIVNIKDFIKDETITFQHPSYKNHHCNYSELESMNYVVKLEESVIDLNEIIISANKWEQKKKDVPNKIKVISAKERAFNNPATAADLLESSGEVFVQRSQLGGGSPMIRGFSTNRVLIVIDGVRMNNAIFRSGNSQNIISIDANAVENTEIIFGPGSIIYGSDAIGGVMDFHTLEPKLSKNSKGYIHGNAFMRYASVNNEKTEHIDLCYSKEKWAILTSITNSSFGDLRMGDTHHEEYQRLEYVQRISGNDSIIRNSETNIQKFSGYSQQNFMQKIRYRPNKNWDIQYAFHYSELSDVPRYDRLTEYDDNKLKYAEWYYGPQVWTMNMLKIRSHKATKIYDNAKMILATQQYQESRHDRKFGKEEIRERTENVNIASLNFDFDKSLNDKNILFYGIEGLTNTVFSKGETRSINSNITSPIASRYPNGSSYNSMAAYISVKSTLSDKLSCTSGVRFNQTLLTATFDTSFYNFPFQDIKISPSALIGSVGMIYRPIKTWQFNFNFSTGFRSPNIDDIGKIFDSEPGFVVVPNNDLQSEYAYNIDFGIIKTIKESIQFEATGFYTILENAIVRRNFLFNGQDSILYDGELSRVQSLVNTDNATVYGIQSSLLIDLMKHFSFKTNVTYILGEDAEGYPLRHVSPLYGSAHLIFNAEKIKADFYLKYNGEISNEDMASSEQSKTHIYATDTDGNPYSPAWHTFNCKFSYQINKTVQVNTGIENIANIRYRPYSSGIVAPGRNIYLTLRCNL